MEQDFEQINRKNMVEDLCEALTLLSMRGVIETEEHPMAYGDVLFKTVDEAKFRKHFDCNLLLMLNSIINQCEDADLLSESQDGSYRWLMVTPEFNEICESLYQ